jgi:uncharacterized protein DUF3846
MHNIVIQSDGTYEVIHGKIADDLDRLQKLVGGYIELVQVKYKGRRYNAFVNEEGKLYSLAYNPKATALYHNAFDTGPHYENLDFEPSLFINPVWDRIVGPMVITGVRD